MSGETRRRSYSSPLRIEQANRTRDLILDALTDLLADHRIDEVSTRQIAERAGVSQPTVYRHFPDRGALVNGLADRVEAKMNALTVPSGPRTIDELGEWAEAGFMITDDHAAEATAEAVLNSDPRRFSSVSKHRSDQFVALVADALPELAPRDQLRVAALMRTLVSVQMWLRMREEFGLASTESGPLVRWAVTTLVREIRAGNFDAPARD